MSYPAQSNFVSAAIHSAWWRVRFPGGRVAIFASHNAAILARAADALIDAGFGDSGFGPSRVEGWGRETWGALTPRFDASMLFSLSEAAQSFAFDSVAVAIRNDILNRTCSRVTVQFMLWFAYRLRGAAVTFDSIVVPVDAVLFSWDRFDSPLGPFEGLPAEFNEVGAASKVGTSAGSDAALAAANVPVPFTEQITMGMRNKNWMALAGLVLVVGVAVKVSNEK